MGQAVGGGWRGEVGLGEGGGGWGRQGTNLLQTLQETGCPTQTLSAAMGWT
jgi:hypothetical protein